MTGKQYIEIQMTMIRMGQQATKLDIDSFLKSLATAEAAGPVVDPTLYRRAIDNMLAIKKLALAVQEVKIAFDAIQVSVAKTAAEMLAGREDDDSEHA